MYFLLTIIIVVFIIGLYYSNWKLGKQVEEARKKKNNS